MGFWGTLGKIAGAVGAGVAAPLTGGASLTALPTILGAAGAGLGAISSGHASNRGQEFGGQLALQNLLMNRDQQAFNNSISREQEGRASATDAIKKLLGAQRILNPMQRPNVSPYSAPQRQYTDAERTGAQALSDEVMQRLQGGNPIGPFVQSPMQVDPRLLKPGTLERIFGIASPILGAAGQIGNRNSNQGIYSVARV